jgi:ubiquinone/menaquinone biosynthesis C-methylase UbiE
VSVVTTLLNQCRKPTGWLGRFTIWRMNRWHSQLTDWGLSHVAVKTRDTILDVGCGGGKTVAKLAVAAPEGRIYGIDYSDASVAASRRTTAPWIATGRVEIRQAAVSQLPFPDRMFDLVTAVETLYFWPDPPADVREVLQVLKPGGSLVIIAEAYKGFKGGEYDYHFERLAELTGLPYAHLSVAEHADLLKHAGFADVQVLEQRDKSWLYVTGSRPS